MAQQPLRVAQIIGKWNTGGVRTMLVEYSKCMDPQKVQFDFIIDEDSDDLIGADIDAAGGRKFIIPRYERLPAYFFALRKLLRENGYLVAHAHITALNVFPLCAAACAGVPVRVSHSHSTAHASESPARLVMKYALRPFSRLFATDYCTCGEKAGRWLFGDKCYEAGHVLLLPNAVDTARFRYDAAARARLRAELGFGAEDFVLGHAGRFMHQKNHMGLLDIYAALVRQKPDAKLLLVGDGELRESVRAAVHKRADIPEQNVVFTGIRADVDKLYSAMDVFCLPSFFEGMPVVAAETQCAGLPCVYADTISPEAGITPLAHFAPLAAPSEAWADSILTAASAYGPRRSWDGEVAAAGFDIRRQGAVLQAFYLRRAAQAAAKRAR